MFKLFDTFTIDLKHIILPIIYIAVGIAIYAIIRKILKKIFKISKFTIKTEEKQRAKTIQILLLNIIKYIIVILVLLAILSVYGMNVKSIVAGLGITTAIIGLAFQDIAKDLIAGISIITENNYEVGDIIEVDAFKGEVVFMGLKTTRIRNAKGAIKIIANRYMDKMINYSYHEALALIDVIVDQNNDPKKVEVVLNDLVKKLSGKIPNATGKLQIWKVDDVELSIVFRLAVEVKPMEQFTVEKYLQEELKKAFAAANIKIPTKQVEVHNGK